MTTSRSVPFIPFVLASSVAAVLLACSKDTVTAPPEKPSLAIWGGKPCGTNANSTLGGENQSGQVGQPLAKPLIVQVLDVAAGTRNGQILNFVVTSGGGTLFASVVATANPSSGPAAGCNGIGEDTWALGPTAGPQTVAARVVDPTNGATLTEATFHATATAGPAATLKGSAGDQQTAIAGRPVAIPPAVLVTDQYGNPIPGVSVTFAVASGGGSITGPTPTTGSNGVAAVGTWTLGTTAGSNTVTATSTGLVGSPVTFTAVGTTGNALKLLSLSGNNQSASPGSTLPSNPTVQVIDANGNGVPNVAVTFTVTSGGGSMDGVSSVTTLTAGASSGFVTGSAQVAWTLGPTAGTNTLQATAVGLSGSPLVFSATATQATWTQLSPTPDPTYGTPSLRILNTTVYNTANKRLIIFGGGGSGGYGILNDVWVLTNADGTGGPPTWIQLNPSGGPPGAREGHVAVYDQANNRMIIQGGYTKPGYCEGVVGDVWVLSNADGTGGTPTWAQLSPTGTTPGRRFHGAAYDPVNNRLIINGGGPAGCGPGVNDTWVLSNANGLGGTPAWSQLAASAPSNFPSDASGGNTGYDAVTNTLIRFLTLNGSVSTWLLSNGNGIGGSPAWRELAASPGPIVNDWVSGVSSGGGVYDQGTNAFALFGGNTVSSQIWTLANANGVGTAQWTQLSPTGTLPVGRVWSFAGSAPRAGRLTISGGSKNGSDGTNEVWVLTGIR